MAAPKFTKNNVEQTIDLKEVLGVSLRGRRTLREELGQAILDKIRDRSDAGEGVSFGQSGRATTVKLKSPYSKEYVDTPEFKAFGKSRGKVNMQLTGDMLGLMDIKRQTGDTLTIGWSDKEQNRKAFNHSTGDTVPRRPFFGCSAKELKEIAREFRDQIRDILRGQS